ncbi:fimbrial biogenesis outer membrane usher protein [Klebsiella aerogenes]|nr:fimbrial biogenesis outer membrane usher protein [Klebsiella aerogenes]ELA2606818.1 fimbrial biogenesis outer membrane usher protein [Klebsiella aerogenes]EMC9823460.1 fimbrial biogenesis outer membrane usher protein [Klebsiella aerogenes]HEO1674993.1 fimbrial biogenesis outer membrane usher protein [Klebsiella aerogenes]
MNRRYKQLYLIILSTILVSQKSFCLEFDTSLLAGMSGQSDLSRFYNTHDIPPGIKDMDIFINGDWKGRYSIIFGNEHDDIRLKCEDVSFLGIAITHLEKGKELQDDITLHELVQGGKVEVDASTMSIRLTIPQAYLPRIESGYIAPKFWDEGIPALLLSYNMNYYNTRLKSINRDNDDDFYTGLDSGINLLGWQFRDSSSWRKASSTKSIWQNNTRYIRKPIALIKSNLMIGDFYTSGGLFDSLRIRGIGLSSEIKMRPNSQQGFSPVVRGVARTNALVRVIQNGNTIYQENVPPGPFKLDNIQPTGSAGDLKVIVHEADGSEQSFTVPFSAVPGMLHEGVSDYGLTIGKVHQVTFDQEPAFMQGTLRYGFDNLVTGYIGSIISNNYQSGLIGAGWNLPFGAVSIDITHAQTKLTEHTENGQSFRIAYSKFLDSTSTNFTLAAYRYSTRGYYSFSDALYAQESYQHVKRYYDTNVRYRNEQPFLDLNAWDAMNNNRPKNTFTLNLNQRLGAKFGTIFFSGTQRDYWGSSYNNREYQFGYSNSLGGTSYTLSASRVKNNDNNQETRFYVSLNLPFSLFENSAWLTTSITSTDSHYDQANISLSGNAMSSNRLSYSISGSNQHGGDSMAGINTAYRSNVSTLGASYSESADYRQGGLSARGSIVGIPGHFLAANEIGTTMTVIDAPYASGLMVNGDESVLTNKQGLALVPYATPYRKNSITLSKTDNSAGAEILGNMGNIAPYDGAVSYLYFKTDTRNTWLIHALLGDKTPLPFGSEVYDEHGDSVGFVGQSSIIYVQAKQKPTSLTVHFSKGKCTVNHPQYGINSISSYCK